MKKTKVILTIGILAIMLLAGANTVSACNQGLTPGYWKNHTSAWPSEVRPNQKIEYWFNLPAGLSSLDVTLIEALSFKGGTGNIGMARNLLRSAVAALLNAYTLDYYYTPTQVINKVNGVLDDTPLSRTAMENLKNKFDYYNNLGVE